MKISGQISEFMHLHAPSDSAHQRRPLVLSKVVSGPQAQKHQNIEQRNFIERKSAFFLLAWQLKALRAVSKSAQLVTHLAYWQDQIYQATLNGAARHFG